MKSIGIREFRDRASHYLSSQEAIAVKRHGKLIGFYIPVPLVSEKIEVKQALQKLNQTVEKAISESGMDLPWHVH